MLWYELLLQIKRRSRSTRWSSSSIAGPQPERIKARVELYQTNFHGKRVESAVFVGNLEARQRVGEEERVLLEVIGIPLTIEIEKYMEKYEGVMGGGERCDKKIKI